MQTCDTVANKPFKVGLKAAFKYYLYDELNKWLALNPDKETRGVWNPKFNMSTLKERISGFVNIGMDTLKTPEMKICIANAFARDSRFTIIRSEERAALVLILYVICLGLGFGLGKSEIMVKRYSKKYQIPVNFDRHCIFTTVRDIWNCYTG